MKMLARDRLIFAMGYISTNKDLVDSVTEGELARALLLSISRLQHIFGEIRDSGLANKEKRDSIAGHILTRSGEDRYGTIFDEISSRELVPELHQVSVRCKVSYLMDVLKNPLDLVYIISCFLMRKKVDIIEKIEQLKAINPNSNDSIKLKELLLDSEEDMGGLENIISDLTLLGSRSDRPEDPDDYTTNSIDSMLIIADLKRRRGEVKESRWYYTSVLEKRNTLRSSRWIICIVGLIQCIRMLEGEEKALKHIRAIYPTIKDPVHLSMVRKVEADILSDKGMFDEARRMYNSCLTTFRKRGLVLMEISILNNFGVMLFRQDKHDVAEKNWIKARNKAHKSGFIWVKSAIEINLSDTFALKGRIKRAKNMLYDSKHVMEESRDAEGLSDVHFNLALVSIEEGKFDTGLEYFQMSEDFPLVYLTKRNERRSVFKKRLTDKGFDPSRTVFK